MWNVPTQPQHRLSGPVLGWLVRLITQPKQDQRFITRRTKIGKTGVENDCRPRAVGVPVGRLPNCMTVFLRAVFRTGTLLVKPATLMDAYTRHFANGVDEFETRRCHTEARLLNTTPVGNRERGTGVENTCEPGDVSFYCVLMQRMHHFRP